LSPEGMSISTATPRFLPVEKERLLGVKPSVVALGRMMQVHIFNAGPLFGEGLI
jgi:hypothetical protein